MIPFFLLCRWICSWCSFVSPLPPAKGKVPFLLPSLTDPWLVGDGRDVSLEGGRFFFTCRLLDKGLFSLYGLGLFLSENWVIGRNVPFSNQLRFPLKKRNFPSEMQEETFRWWRTPLPHTKGDSLPTCGPEGSPFFLSCGWKGMIGDFPSLTDVDRQKHLHFLSLLSFAGREVLPLPLSFPQIRMGTPPLVDMTSSHWELGVLLLPMLGPDGTPLGVNRNPLLFLFLPFGRPNPFFFSLFFGRLCWRDLFLFRTMRTSAVSPFLTKVTRFFHPGDSFSRPEGTPFTSRKWPPNSLVRRKPLA